jgi:solute carrier family 6 GABA transporter-like protein 6/8/11/12/13
MVETVITALEDEFQHHIKKVFKKRELLVLIVCCGLFLLALPNLCPGGIYYFTILDFFSAGISVFYIAFFEIIAIVWLYGAKRLARNIYLMNGQTTNYYFLACWYFITPAFILVIWLFNWYQYEPLTYEDKPFNAGAQAFGWCIALVSIIAIPLGAIDTLRKAPGKSLCEKLILSLKPTIEDLRPNFKTEQNVFVSVENRATEFIKKGNENGETVYF